MFVALILASIFFQQNLAISICGDGHVIGRPDATIKLYQQDVSGRLTCRRLENDVTHGIISLPTQEQQALIDDVCDCQPSYKESNMMNTGRALGNSPTHGLRHYPAAALAKPTSNNAPSIPVPFYLFLPSITPPSSAPSILLNFPPTLSPQEQMMIRSKKERLFLILGVCICITVTFLILFICVATLQQRHRSLASRRTNIHTMTACSGLQESDDIRKERRRIVISLLFPVQGAEAVQQESKSLGDHDKAQTSMEPESESQCPICLEDAIDDLITGRCSHIYHRECIMTWMHDGHDECPNCRQLMWDQDAYNFLHQYVKANGIKVMSK